MTWQPTTRLQISGYRFTRRRIEAALLCGDVAAAGDVARSQARSLLTGGVLAAVLVAGCALIGVLRPPAVLGDAPIVMGHRTGALYVRLGDTWHPVLNLASARLIAATTADPQPVRESALAATRRGPLLGIAGAPQFIGEPLREADAAWTVCDTGGVTTVIVGAVHSGGVEPLAAEQTVLVTADNGASTYLLNQGRRAAVNLTDPAVARALRVDGRPARPVSPLLLNVVPEAPPISRPPVPGDRGPGALPGFAVGSVVRVARTGADEYYVVLPGGVQRVGRVAADLLRFADSRGSREVVAVAPDVIGVSEVVSTLPVATFPDRVDMPLSDTVPTVCATWTPGRTALLAGAGPAVPSGRAPVTLAQADGDGPALDAVYLPPARSAYLRSTGLSGDWPRSGTRYLISDTGVRFAIPDQRDATNLGLPETAVAAPWPLLAALPAGPELSRRRALVAHDTVGAP